MTEDTDRKDPLSSPENLVEVYRSSGFIEANRAIVEVLEAAGIPCICRDRLSHALPAPDAQAGAYFVAVPVSAAADARELLRTAIADRALDASAGEILA